MAHRSERRASSRSRAAKAAWQTTSAKETAVRPLKFAFSEAKAVEALAVIAAHRPGFTPFFVSKVLFFAEKWHLNRYGRPITADTYIAMPQGPVPSSVKHFLDSDWRWSEKPQGFDEAITLDHAASPVRLLPGSRAPNLDLLSETDVECLIEAIAYCNGKTRDDLSTITHFDKAWQSADPNRAMDYALFIEEDNPNRAELLKIAREAAAYGVL